MMLLLKKKHQYQAHQKEFLTMLRCYMGVLKFCLLSFFFLFFGHASAIVYGTDGAVSRYNTLRFPWTDANNQLLGFVSADGGFMLGDYTTTCSFNAFFPVSEDMNLGGGTLYLQEDLSFTNTFRWISPGVLWGNDLAVKLPKSSSDIKIPEVEGVGCVTVRDLPSAIYTVTDQINGVDWAPGNWYVASVQNFSATGLRYELRALYFSGTTLTQSGGIDIATTSPLCVRWHPKSRAPYYLAVGRTSNATGNEIYIYSYTHTTSAFANTASINQASSVAGVEWHPSGQLLLAGITGTFYTYNFNAGALTLNQTFTPPTTAVNAFSFSPGGNFVAAGETLIRLYSVAYGATAPAGLKLTAGLTIAPGTPTLTLDWCPTGTYIAAGFGATTDRLRIYKHLAGSNTLTEVLTARIGEAATVSAVQWSADGKVLYYCTNNAAASIYAAYYFDQTSETLTPVFRSLKEGVALRSIRRSPNDQYLARGTAATGQVKVVRTRRVTEPQVFYNTALVLNSNAIVHDNWRIKGTCTIIGNNKMLSLDYGKKIELMAGAQLTLQGLELVGVAGTNLRCITDNSSITLSDCTLSLSSDYTFSKGAFVFDNDVIISGTNKFNYTSAIASRIYYSSTLLLDNGITFSYAPRIASKDLLAMYDNTSGLYLNGATLFSTCTGLRLSNGTLYLDNNVTFSNQARNSGEAMELSPSLNIQVLAAAVLDIYGKIKYV